MELNIRNATKADVTFVAECVLVAIDLYDFCGDCAKIENTAKVCSEEDTLYSYRNARIAEVDGNVAGCLISYDGKGYAESRAKTFAMFEEFGIHLDIGARETGPGEYYLDSMAVKPQYRGLRIGHFLMEDALDIAHKTQGCHKATLLVGLQKPRLREYYSSLGFTTETEMEAFGTLFNKMALTL